MGVILNIYAKNITNFFHEGGSAGSFVFAVHIIAPVDLVDFAGSSASGGSFEIARKAEHGDVTGVLVETDEHDGIGKLGAVVGTVTLVAIHIVAAGAKGEDISATICVGF